MKLSVFFSADKYTSHGREDKSESSLDCGGVLTKVLSVIEVGPYGYVYDEVVQS